MEEIFASLAIVILVTLHVIVILILLGGAILAATGYLGRRAQYERIYFTIIILTILSFISTGACILTTWEQQFRARYFPETAYTGGFISHFLNRLGLRISDDSVFWTFVTVIVVGIMATLYYRTRRTNA